MYSITTTSKLYRDFNEIDGEAYHTIVRFYESNAKEIQALKFNIYFEILVNYTNALFEIGAYSKHIIEVDKIIGFSIQHNIQFYKGEDIYFKSLFQKAASYYNRLELQKAEHILRELLKMSPYHGLSIRFLQKCLASTQPPYIKKARAASIFLFLTAALIAAVEVMFIQPFANSWAVSFEWLRISIFASGILILLGTYFFHLYQVNRIVDSFLKKIRQL